MAIFPVDLEDQPNGCSPGDRRRRCNRRVGERAGETHRGWRWGERRRAATGTGADGCAAEGGPRADARGGAAAAGARSLGGERRRPRWWAGQGQGWVLCVHVI